MDKISEEEKDTKVVYVYLFIAMFEADSGHVFSMTNLDFGKIK